MKQLKFQPNLVELILSGDKTTTWRLFDDKNLSIGDEVEFLSATDKSLFAKAKLIEVYERTIGDLRPKDWAGHEKIQNPVKHYSILYNKLVTPETKVKIIKFNLLR